MRLKDKVAIITGGSRGIGYATADKFLKEGATVILTASSQGSADKAVAQLKEKYPDATVAGISPNLSNLESVRNAFREAASKYGCIDILVNNAGVSESTPFTEYTEETFDKVMDLNVKGVFNATRAASECMIAKGQGVILSTSSMVSIYGQPSGFAYPASKFAVNGLTVSLARELGPKVMSEQITNRLVLDSSSTCSSFSKMGKAKARWIPATTRGRKNTSSTWLLMVWRTSRRLMPTFCRIWNRVRSS